MTTPSVPVSAQAQRDEIRDTAHGGPLWEPLCYAQIGGLTVATFITLLLANGVLFDFRP